MASLKQAFLFIAFFVAISVNISWGPKVMALRDLPSEVAKMKGEIVTWELPSWTCGRSCHDARDCMDGWMCNRCSRSIWDVTFGSGRTCVGA